MPAHDPRIEEGHRLAEGGLRCILADCGNIIPDDRVVRKAVTCCDDHANVLKNLRRARRDMKRCRLCSRPCTPAERADFQLWRREREGEKRGRPKAKKEETVGEEVAPSE